MRLPARVAGLGRYGGFMFAFAAATSYGVAQVITRQHVPDEAPPLVAATIALAWGTLGFLLLSVRSLRRPYKNLKRGVWLFALTGVFSAVGFACVTLALEKGTVVTVAPITSTNPLFTLVLAAIFLRDVEHVTPQILLGAVLVVAGVVVLTVA
jgi:drug/metabolite transporter (DMT)-like permease